MAKTSSVSSKGQVTIPQEVRTRLGLHAGDRVEFVMEGDRTILRPTRAPENPFRKYMGSLPAFKTAEEVNDWLADLRDDRTPQ
jgi:AbrB family looped-hinge helix DNA binding protein